MVSEGDDHDGLDADVPAAAGSARQRPSVAFVRESVYTTFTGLALVAVSLFGGHEPSAAEVFVTVALGIVGITLAGLVAELIAELITHNDVSPRDKWADMAATAAGAIGTAALPLLALGPAALGWITIDLALQLSIGFYFVTIVVFLLAATWRSHLTKRQRLGSLGMLVGMAIVVLLALSVAKNV